MIGLLRRFGRGVAHVFLGGLEHRRRVDAAVIDGVHHHIHGAPPQEEDSLLQRRPWLDAHAPEADAEG
jgi:hypothetical protein